MSAEAPPPIRKHLACVSVGALYGLVAGAVAGKLTYYMDAGEGPFEAMLSGLMMGVVCGSYASTIPIVLTQCGQRFAATTGVLAGSYGVLVALLVFTMINFSDELLERRVLIGSSFCLAGTIASSLTAVCLVEMISEDSWNRLFHDEMPTVAVIVAAVCLMLVFRAFLYDESGLAWCVGVVPGTMAGSCFAVSLLNAFCRKCCR